MAGPDPERNSKGTNGKYRRHRQRKRCTDDIDTDQAAIDAYLETHPVTHLPTGAESNAPTCWTKTGNHIGNFMKTVARYK